MGKRLYRSRKDRMVCGVCGGLAEHFNIDPVIVRLIFVLLIFADGLGILAYIVLAIVFPSAEKVPSRSRQSQTDDSEAAGRRNRVLGIILIIVGALILVANFYQTWWVEWINIWPVVIVVLGALILLLNARKR